jgi:hypothetical protein
MSKKCRACHESEMRVANENYLYRESGLSAGAFGLLAAMATASCAGAVVGRDVTPVPFGRTTAEVRTDEAEGLRILWNGPARQRRPDEEAASRRRCLTSTSPDT